MQQDQPTLELKQQSRPRPRPDSTMATRQSGSTIFLTREETERIRATVKAKVQKCSENAGRAREPRDAKTAISQATGAALMADMGNMTMAGSSGNDKVPALAVGDTYPPCTVSLQDLQPMQLAVLRMETHHRGRKLTVKRASPVVTLASRSWTMVQDDAEQETERLEVCLHKLRHGKDVLESASLFVIKEPYFTLTEEGEPTIRIDHPSDLVVCGEGDDQGKEQAEGDAAAAEQAAKVCKDKGNAALGKGDLSRAHSHYTEGLRLARREDVASANPDLARDLSRNRAHVNLLLSQFDEAKADAITAHIGRDDERSKELDAKAFFRAGTAAYSLGQFREAKEFFEKQQALMPQDKAVAANLARIKVRLREEETGKYDFTKIRAGLSKVRPRVDAANFIANTEVRDSPGRGRGLFATRPIAAGELVLCEKAFCVVWGYEPGALSALTYDVRDDEIRVSPVGLTRAIVQKLLANPSRIPDVMDLYDDGKAGPSVRDVVVTAEGPVVDVFRVHHIVSRDAFGTGSSGLGDDADRDGASSGIWVRAAYINHSCVANTEKEFIGDLLVARASRPIAAGEEIFISYDLSSDYNARQKALKLTWGFECDCALCAVEKTDNPDVRKKRAQLAAEADEFVRSVPWAGAKRLSIVKAQRLAKSIDDTYDDRRYKDLPRLAGREIWQWLAQASQRR